MADKQMEMVKVNLNRLEVKITSREDMFWIL